MEHTTPYQLWKTLIQNPYWSIDDVYRARFSAESCHGYIDSRARINKFWDSLSPEY